MRGEHMTLLDGVFIFMLSVSNLSIIHCFLVSKADMLTFKTCSLQAV